MTVDEIFELVANNIYSSIETDNWDKAVLNISGDDTSMALSGYSYLCGHQIQLDVRNFDLDVEFALMELHEITTEGGGNPWNTAEFTLYPDGRFNVDFDSSTDKE